MDDLLPAVLVVGFMVAVVLLAIRARREFDAAVRRSFEALAFETPAGRVRWDAVRVVKVVAHDSGNESSGPQDLFWYCVGSGPSYFLALGHVRGRLPRIRVDWVVRPLSEDRMRNALIGDDRATALAFGDAVEG